jgi:ADP-ribosylation factor-like protein 8
MGNILRSLLQRFSTKKLEVVLVGLENSGKSTLLQVLGNGSPVETAPTIGLNVKMVKRGGVQMKCWDLGGQAQYRAEWGRYTRGCNVIIFVIDSHEINLLPDAKAELHRLLEDRYANGHCVCYLYSYVTPSFLFCC